MSSLGERIRQLRVQHKLTQQEFAHSLGISQSFLSDMERGTKIPGGDTLLSLKRSYHVSTDWILSGEVEMYAEGENPGDRPPAPPVDETRMKVLDERVQELEREILMLKGQIAASREVILTLKPT